MNSLDSAFCKKCGKPLAKEEAMDAREALDKQLDHAFELFHHGRTDESWLNVESCLIADPDNLRALSLKGLILERRGLIQDAIECYERIVAKDPDAALERMKLQTLRGMLDAHRYEAPNRDRRLALGIAICVGLLFICVVGAFAIAHRQPSTVAVVDTGKPSYSVDSFSQGDVQSSKPEQAKSDQAGVDSSSTSSTEVDKNKPDASNAKIETPSLSGSLPDPSKEDSKPVNPLENAEIKLIPSNDQSVASPTSNANVGAPANNGQSDPDPSTVAQPADTKPAAPPPVVDIKLSQDQPKDSDLAIDANGIEAMVRTARGQYQVGNYQAAAATYERALSAGADPAMTNQRLAQCYERLGRTSEAEAAYTRAITAIQTQINSGKGNKDRLLAALNSSQQALKNLQGG